eukprot:Opistho-2@72413
MFMKDQFKFVVFAGNVHERTTPASLTSQLQELGHPAAATRWIWHNIHSAATNALSSTLLEGRIPDVRACATAALGLLRWEADLDAVHSGQLQSAEPTLVPSPAKFGSGLDIVRRCESDQSALCVVDGHLQSGYKSRRRMQQARRSKTLFNNVLATVETQPNERRS